MKSPSLFTRIVRGEIPADIVAEDDHHMAFLDIAPVAAGHTLVIPKREVDDFFDLEAEELAGLMQFAQRVARAIKKVIPCLRIGMHVHGLEVPHAHIHLVPLMAEQAQHFPRPAIECPASERKRIAEQIRRGFA